MGGNCCFVQLPIAIVVLLQLAIATYGGFFGGGGGILMLAVLNIMGINNVHTINAFKSWLATCLNAAAIIHFMLAQTIVWYQATVMVIGALVGGYGSAYFARQIDPNWVRCFIICVGLSMSIYFFLHQVS